MILIYALLFIIGTVFGSFYTVVATRLPNKKSIIKPRSYCDHCHKTLQWYELIPIVSYIIFRGKCHHCHKKIDITSTIIEILFGVSNILVFMFYNNSLETFILLELISLFLIILVSDIKYYIINDSVLITVAIIMFITIFYFNGPTNALYHLLCGIIMFGIIYIVKLTGDWAFGQESLGGGDVKLSVIMGLALKLRLGLIAFAIGAFIALPFALISTAKTKSHIIPFGPFLALGTILTFMFGKYIIYFLTHL